MLIGYYIIGMRIKNIKPWYFLVLALVSGVICIGALRANNQHMSELRDAVYAADKNNGDVKGALQELQAYVTTHMNTNLASGKTAVYPPIQLKYTYDRLVAAQNEKFAKGSSLYNEAQRYCEGQNSTDFSGRNRVPCIEQYVQSHTSSKPSDVPDSLYKFSFASPRWSPDLAGWTMLITVFSFITFIGLVIIKKALR
jgi:hypothetical protein